MTIYEREYERELEIDAPLDDGFERSESPANRRRVRLATTGIGVRR